MILVYFYLNGETFITKKLPVTPRKGDMVNINGQCFLVESIVWNIDDSVTSVAIDITEEVQLLPS